MNNQNLLYTLYALFQLFANKLTELFNGALLTFPLLPGGVEAEKAFPGVRGGKHFPGSNTDLVRQRLRGQFSCIH